jgi:hypothetical protein
MISKSISVSRKLAKAEVFTALAFTWLIAHCDDGGNMAGDPETVKMLVLPGRPETIKDVERALKEMTTLGLIDPYKVKGEEYIHIVNWEDHQTLRLDRATWEYPEYPKAELSGNQVATTRKPTVANLAAEGKVSKGKVREGKVMGTVITGFDEFWSLYPRKTAKKTAQRSWAKISPDEELRKRIMEALGNHCKLEQWTKDEGRFIPHPATWLNNERWDDELKGKPKVGGGRFEQVTSKKA